MKKIWLSLLVSVLASLLAAACGPAASSGPRTLTIMTHDSFAVSDNVKATFESANNVRLQFIKSGDAGAALGKAILAKGQPLADVFYGVDNTFLSRALSEGIYEPYASPILAQIPEAFKLDPTNSALPVDYGDVCLNYDKAYFNQHALAPPANLEDLARPDYKDLLVLENPGTSSTGLAFLLATVGHFGDPGYLGYWRSLRANGALVVDSWDTAYATDFSGSAGHGPRPIVVSYGSSPPFEVIGASTPLSDAPTAAVVSDGSCFRQIEFVGILKGTPNLDLAQKWVDFMLSPIFQADMPLQMYVFPVNSKAPLNATFQKYLAIPAHPAVVSPADIAANRDRWIEAWTQAVLR